MAKIPRFRTEQEMREFWDAHDSAEYFEDMKDDEVEVEFNRDKGVLVIPMGEDRVRSLRGIALEEGVFKCFRENGSMNVSRHGGS